MPTTSVAALLSYILLATACASPPGPLEPLAIPAGENPERWADDMARFAEQDAAAAAAPGSVVFVGSSSIRLWDSLARDMAPILVVQRGFGGSRLFDACYWSERLVSRHAPGAVVVFSGTNDIAGDQPKSAAQVRDLFRLFVSRVRHFDPDVPICFIAITPTASRRRHLPIVIEANRLIRADCERELGLEFLDPTPDLTTAAGEPDPQYFRPDRLHLNASGYAVWTRHIRPAIERIYGR